MDLARPMSCVRLLACSIAVARAAVAQPDAAVAGTNHAPNGAFEAWTGGKVDGWAVPGSVAGGTELRSIRTGGPDGSACVSIRPLDPRTATSTLMTTITDRALSGRLVRFSADVRVLDHGSAQMWLRVDGENRPGYFDNMEDRPIRGETWARYEIVGPVADDMKGIAVGFMVHTGGALIDNVRLEVLGDAPAPLGPEDSAAIERPALDGAVAGARLIAYIRYFHPSDEALALDWRSYSVAIMERAESAASKGTLVDVLRELVAPVAPSIEISTSPLPNVTALPEGATEWRSWHNVGLPPPRRRAVEHSVYHGEVVTRDLNASVGAGTLPGTCIVAELCPGVYARVPIGVYVDAQGSLPRASGAAALPECSQRWVLCRAVRLTSVAQLWGAMQHFFPYFDVVGTDWNEVLPEYLRSAATDADPDSFGRTLARMASKLHDGHVRVSSAPHGQHDLPFALAWAGDELVVETVLDTNAAAGVIPGDVILSIDGTPTPEASASVSSMISSATEGWMRDRVLSEIGAGRKVPATLLVRGAGGHERSVTVDRIVRTSYTPSPAHPQCGDEIAPGVVYIDLNGTAWERVAPLLPKLEQARAIVLDARGYPDSAGTRFISHIIDSPVTCAQWHIPIADMPDRAGMKFEFSNWKIRPESPRLRAKIVYVTDGTAISYAETCMGIVEAYKLGEIVGERTAGTNGNINSISLADGTSVRFTGMKVLKHDGSRHHGVGILPTVPASRTVEGIRAGRDELLEKAIEVATGG